MKTSETYNESFYRQHETTSLESARETIPIILDLIQPQSVLDIGCATGAWLSIWRELGVRKIKGMDGPHMAGTRLLIEAQNFEIRDFETGFTPDETYDLVTCLEVAEHLRADSAEKFIHSLCSCGNLILFSAAIPFQEGTLHKNEQFPSYWVSLFSRYDYVPIDCIREKIWENEKISFWYRQNILFFLNRQVLENFPQLKAQQKPVLSLVHPELLTYKQNKIREYEKILRSPLRTASYFVKKYFRGLRSLIKK